MAKATAHDRHCSQLVCAQIVLDEKGGKQHVPSIIFSRSPPSRHEHEEEIFNFKKYLLVVPSIYHVPQPILREALS